MVLLLKKNFLIIINIIFHGFAWYATYFKAIETTYYWIKDLAEKNILTDYEIEIAKVGIGEFCYKLSMVFR